MAGCAKLVLLSQSCCGPRWLAERYGLPTMFARCEPEGKAFVLLVFVVCVLPCTRLPAGLGFTSFAVWCAKSLLVDVCTVGAIAGDIRSAHVVKTTAWYLFHEIQNVPSSIDIHAEDLIAILLLKRQ